MQQEQPVVLQAAIPAGSARLAAPGNHALDRMSPALGRPYMARCQEAIDSLMQAEAEVSRTEDIAGTIRSTVRGAQGQQESGGRIQFPWIVLRGARHRGDFVQCHVYESFQCRRSTRAGTGRGERMLTGANRNATCRTVTAYRVATVYATWPRGNTI